MKQIYDNKLYGTTIGIPCDRIKEVWDKLPNRMKEYVFTVTKDRKELNYEMPTILCDNKAHSYAIADFLTALGYTIYMAQGDIDWYKLNQCHFLDYRLWDKTDKIYTTESQRQKIATNIIKLLDSNKLSWSDLVENVPLPNGFFMDNEKKTFFYYTYSKIKDELRVRHYELDERDFPIEMMDAVYSNVSCDEYEVEVLAKHKYMPSDLKDIHDQNINLFFFLNFFILSLPSAYTIKTNKVAESITTGKGNNKRTKLSVRLVKTYTINQKITNKYIQHHFSCLCWSVRGHLRHYKSGKVVFVKPFRKGRERGNFAKYKAKEYNV